MIEFADGSLGTLHYLANGHRSLSKERLEVFCEGAVLQLDNFRRLQGFGWPGFTSMKLWRQDKGNAAGMAAFVAAVASGAAFTDSAGRKRRGDAGLLRGCRGHARERMSMKAQTRALPVLRRHRGPPDWRASALLAHGASSAFQPDRLAAYYRLMPVPACAASSAAAVRRDLPGCRRLQPSRHRWCPTSLPAQISFLNHARPLDVAAVDWVSAAEAKLWRYNLHYFDYLHWPVYPAAMKAQLIDSWIAANPPTAGDGWEPYPLSLRVGELDQGLAG